MFKDLIIPKRRKKPKSETNKKAVSAKRFNEMVAYYTVELKSRLNEIKNLREQLQLLTQTTITTSKKSDETRTQNKKLIEENRILKEKLYQKN